MKWRFLDRWSRVAGLATTLTVLCASVPAAADPQTEADTLFKEAMALLKAGQVAEACPKLARSQLLDPGAGTLFRLAECYEKAGKLVRAWKVFDDTVQIARMAGRKDREEQSKVRMDALRPRIPVIRVSLAPELAANAGLRLSVDGQIVESPNEPVQVDPGEHVLEASAPGLHEWKQTVSLREGQTIAIAIPQLAREKSGEPGVSASEPLGPTELNKPLIAVGVGFTAVALAGAAAFTVLSNGKADDADALRVLVPGNVCIDAAHPHCAELRSSNTQSDTFHNLAVVGFVGAGVGAAATLTYALWPRATTPAARLSLAPIAGPGIGGVTIGGLF